MGRKAPAAIDPYLPRVVVRQGQRSASSRHLLADTAVSGFAIAPGGFGRTLSCRLKAESDLPLSVEGSERIC